nr:helicase C-terminal domain-containing protein [Halorubrum halodurans]
MWGTLAEGVSFDGDDARTVVVVGVPYPHLTPPQPRGSRFHRSPRPSRSGSCPPGTHRRATAPAIAHSFLC